MKRNPLAYVYMKIGRLRFLEDGRKLKGTMPFLKINGL
jgi:hypothetical protein